MLVTPISNSHAQVGGGAVHFRPHRAVYDFSFEHATPGSGVSDMTGRMVYALTGTACEEFTQNMRFVTRMTNQDGVAQVNDLRTIELEEPPSTGCASPPASTRTRSCRKPRRAAPGRATARRSPR